MATIARTVGRCRFTGKARFETRRDAKKAARYYWFGDGYTLDPTTGELREVETDDTSEED